MERTEEVCMAVPPEPVLSDSDVLICTPCFPTGRSPHSSKHKEQLPLTEPSVSKLVTLGHSTSVSQGRCPQ